MTFTQTELLNELINRFIEARKDKDGNVLAHNSDYYDFDGTDVSELIPVDPGGGGVDPEWVKEVNKRLADLEDVVDGEDKTEYIDNLQELLDYFAGVRDDTTHIKEHEHYVEGYDADNISTEEIEDSEVPNSFDNI